MGTPQTPTQGRFTSRHMLMVMGAFFGTIITVNLIMAWFATHSWTGLVVNSSYVASQHFNETTAEKKRQAAMGWTSKIDFDAGQLTLTLADKSALPVADAIVTAQLGHPAHENNDRIVQFRQTEPGHYVASTDLTAGVWQADLQTTAKDGTVWTKSWRLLVKD